MVKNHFSMKQIKGGAAAPRSSSGKKKSDRSTRPSTTHLTEIRQFRDWIRIINEIIGILLSKRKRRLRLPFEFLKINKMPHFGIEVKVDRILFTDENIELYVSKTKNLFLNPGFPGDKILEKYYTRGFSNIKINKEELFRNGYSIAYHERGGGKRQHEEFGALIAQAINTANSAFYDKYWGEPKNHITLVYEQINSYYFTNDKTKGDNEIYKKLPRSYPPPNFRSTQYLVETGRRVGRESGVGKTHIVCKYDCLVLTIYQTIKFLVENEVFFSRGKFIINPLRLDKYFDDVDIKNKFEYDKWVKYLDDIGYSARADVVFYNKPFAFWDEMESGDFKFSIANYSNYMLQHDIDTIIDYFKTKKFYGTPLDRLIGKESNNLAYNKRLSKSIFYAVIERDTASLDGIRDDYADPKKRSAAIKKIISSKVFTTSELESEKKLMCHHKDPKDLVCLKHKWNLDFKDLCQRSELKKGIMPRSLLYGTRYNYDNHFYYISRKQDENNLCKQRSKKKKKKKNKKKKTRRRSISTI